MYGLLVGWRAVLATRNLLIVIVDRFREHLLGIFTGAERNVAINGFNLRRAALFGTGVSGLFSAYPLAARTGSLPANGEFAVFRPWCSCGLDIAEVDWVVKQRFG